jgi:DNA-binding response OmpR family regulator/anti-sigma regulatory factor (Ser/Thr protein kinase)
MEACHREVPISRILVGDDDLATREMLVSFLRHRGHEVSTAADGIETLARYDDFRPNMVLLDVQMPELGGIEVLTTIRQKDSDTCIIMVTATKDEETGRKAIESGANDYITKPIYLEQIETAIAVHLLLNTPDLCTVLIVDDMEINRTLLQDYVTTLGHTTILAENGREGLSKVKQYNPDMVLVDIKMPVMDGYAVLKSLKGDPKTQDLPVIVISGIDDLDSVVRCIEMGAYDYLIKPFKPALLRARLTAGLREKRRKDHEKQLYTDLVESYEALRRSENTRDSLAHMIVHDLNNPLTVIMGRIQFLQMLTLDEAPDREQLLKGLQAAFTASGEMASLIRSILDVSKLEAGQMPVELRDLNATDLAVDVYEQMSTHAEQAHSELSFESESDGIFVSADQDLLSRILQNLLHNALKYAGDGSQVRLWVNKNERQVTFSVSDNGPGIPEPYRPRIFDKYFQIKASPKGKLGVGLGLAFCKMATEAQGGEIRVEVGEEGKGATFIVTLRAAGNQ